MKAVTVFSGNMVTVNLVPTCVHEEAALRHWDGKALACEVELMPHPQEGQHLQQLVFTFTPGGNRT